MATNEVVRFTAAGLPSKDLGTFQRKAQEALQKARDQVAVAGNVAFLRLTKNDGFWVYGQEDTEVEEGSLWAINPFSLAVGVIAWPPANSPLKQPIKKMRAVFDESTPEIDKTTLPAAANGGQWDSCVAFDMQCIGGLDPKVTIEDVGKTLTYQQNSWGGKNAFDTLSTALMKQIEADPACCVPVVELLSDTYTHEKWGKQYNPVFKIHRWISMDGGSGAAEIEDQGQSAAEAAPRQRRAATAASEPETAPPQEEPARRGRRGAAQTETQQVDRGVVQRRRRRS